MPHARYSSCIRHPSVTAAAMFLSTVSSFCLDTPRQTPGAPGSPFEPWSWGSILIVCFFVLSLDHPRVPQVRFLNLGLGVFHLFLSLYFRSTTRRRFPLQFAPIVIHRGTHQIFQRALINLIALEQIDRSPRVASQARVKKLVRIWQVRPMRKGKLHLIFVRVAHRDDSVARPYGASHPLPFLNDLPVGLQDALADAAQRFATPVFQSFDQLVYAFRCIH